MCGGMSPKAQEQNYSGPALPRTRDSGSAGPHGKQTFHIQNVRELVTSDPYSRSKREVPGHGGRT